MGRIDQRIGAYRATMIKIDQKLKTKPYDLVDFNALDVGDKANTKASCSLRGS